MLQNCKIRSKLHLQLDISDSVCITEMFFLQCIFMYVLFLPINTVIISRFCYHLWMRKNILTSRKNLKRKNTPMIIKRCLCDAFAFIISFQVSVSATSILIIKRLWNTHNQIKTPFVTGEEANKQDSPTARKLHLDPTSLIQLWIMPNELPKHKNKNNMIQKYQIKCKQYDKKKEQLKLLTACQKQQIFKCCNQCWLYLRCNFMPKTILWWGRTGAKSVAVL